MVGVVKMVTRAAVWGNTVLSHWILPAAVLWRMGGTWGVVPGLRTRACLTPEPGPSSPWALLRQALLRPSVLPLLTHTLAPRWPTHWYLAPISPQVSIFWWCCPKGQIGLLGPQPGNQQWDLLFI